MPRQKGWKEKLRDAFELDDGDEGAPWWIFGGGLMLMGLFVLLTFFIAPGHIIKWIGVVVCVGGALAAIGGTLWVFFSISANDPAVDIVALIVGILTGVFFTRTKPPEDCPDTTVGEAIAFIGVLVFIGGGLLIFIGFAAGGG